jgi:hypothetical protein
MNNWDILYDFLDQKMIEGSEKAEELIDKYGYTITSEIMLDYINSEAIQGDDRAIKLLQINTMNIQNISENSLEELIALINSINDSIHDYRHVSDYLPTSLKKEVKAFEKALQDEYEKRLTDEQ